MTKDIKEEIEKRKQKKIRAKSKAPKDKHVGKMAGFIADIEERLLKKIEDEYGNVKKADKPEPKKAKS